MSETVPILDHNPHKPGAIEMKGYAIDAYPGPGDFSEEARRLAIRTVAYELGITERSAVNEYEIYIAPGAGFHGRIFALKT